MADPTKRIFNWVDRMSLPAFRAPVITESKLAQMTESVNAVFTSLAAMETTVKQTLDVEGVPTITYPAYLNYGRELWKLQRKEISGTSLQLEALVLLNKWVARGLTQSVLEAIRLQCFNISAPVET